MNVHPKLAPEQQLTIAEILALTASRPDGERWELIEGVAVLNAPPVQVHQMAVGNIVSFLLAQKERTDAMWFPLVGVGTRVPLSPRSLPQPDVYVQAGPPLDTGQCPFHWHDHRWATSTAPVNRYRGFLP